MENIGFFISVGNKEGKKLFEKEITCCTCVQKNMHTTTYVCAKTQCKQYLENSWQMYNILQLVLPNAKAYKSTSNALQIKHEEFSAQVYACIVNPGPPPTRTPARASTPYEDLLTCYYNVVHLKDDFTVTFSKAERPNTSLFLPNPIQKSHSNVTRALQWDCQDVKKQT